MSTIWGGICLDHNPPIEFEMQNGPYEIKSHQLAFHEFRKRDGEDHGHGRCDVVLGGYSYPLVAFSCPCRKHPDHAPPFWQAAELRVVIELSRLGDTVTVGEWLRHNNCWTVERLEKLAPLFAPKIEPTERLGSVNALEKGISDAGWDIARRTTCRDSNDLSYNDLRVYPRKTEATKDEGTQES